MAKGEIDASDYAAALALRPKLLSIMLANNETGVLQNVARRWRRRPWSGSLVPSGCRPGVGQGDDRFSRAECCGRPCDDAVGAQGLWPKGAAALIVDKRVELQPLIAGGGHETQPALRYQNVSA